MCTARSLTHSLVSEHEDVPDAGEVWIKSRGPILLAKWGHNPNPVTSATKTVNLHIVSEREELEMDLYFPTVPLSTVQSLVCLCGGGHSAFLFFYPLFDLSAIFSSQYYWIKGIKPELIPAGRWVWTSGSLSSLPKMNPHWPLRPCTIPPFHTFPVVSILIIQLVAD